MIRPFSFRDQSSANRFASMCVRFSSTIICATYGSVSSRSDFFFPFDPSTTSQKLLICFHNGIIYGSYFISILLYCIFFDMSDRSNTLPPSPGFCTHINTTKHTLVCKHYNSIVYTEENTENMIIILLYTDVWPIHKQRNSLSEKRRSSPHCWLTSFSICFDVFNRWPTFSRNIYFSIRAADFSRILRKRQFIFARTFGDIISLFGGCSYGINKSLTGIAFPSVLCFKYTRSKWITVFIATGLKFDNFRLPKIMFLCLFARLCLIGNHFLLDFFPRMTNQKNANIYWYTTGWGGAVSLWVVSSPSGYVNEK